MARRRRGRLRPSLPPAPRGPLLRYAGGWLIAGALVLLAALWVVRLTAEPEVSLPPVRQTELGEAARAAGCELQRQRRGEALRPPVSGPRMAAARPGAYGRSLEPGSLVGAVRVGTVVIHHRPTLSGELVERLREIQEAVPGGTILAPNPDMPYAVAVTSWRRLLGCRRFGRTAVDAVRLFRGRFIGSGPDR